MKLFFLAFLLRDADPENKGGGFTPEQKGELSKAIGDLQTALESKQKGLVEGELKKHADTINDSLKKFTDWQVTKDEADLKNQTALDGILVKFKDMQDTHSTGRVEAKSLQTALIEALADPENIKGIESVRRGNKYKMALKGPINLSADTQEYFDGSIIHKMDGGGRETKTVGTMTSAASLSGNGLVTQNSRGLITLPAQKVNARDMIRTVRSETGTYVSYKETVGEGAIARQAVPGDDKSQIDFNLSEVKIVNEYISGWTKFAKQLMRDVPFLQNSLPVMLQREFFKVENRHFYDVVATAHAASGLAPVSLETDDIKQIMDWVTQLFDADYVASFGVLRYTALNRINKYLLTNGNYQGSGGVLSNVDGSIRVNGVPIIPVTWVPSYDKFLTFDADYVERVEVESLAIEFFEQDDKNVQQNVITARIECFEAFNPMQPASILLGDLGNSSTS